jgi:hypothetical protein
MLGCVGVRGAALARDVFLRDRRVGTTVPMGGSLSCVNRALAALVEPFEHVLARTSAGRDIPPTPTPRLHFYLPLTGRTCAAFLLVSVKEPVADRHRATLRTQIF